jgi:TRAP-type C4-dicarboxylate transport system permease small subunit
MRQALDSLYRLSGLLSAFFLLMIAVLVTAQIVGRMFDVLIPSADDFARLSMAASSFLGLAWALRRGAHIRVALLLEKFSPSRRRAAELVCLALGTALTGYFAFYAIDMVIDGILFPEFTIGLIPIPKWIPQIAMATGAVVLFIAFLDDLVVVASGGTPSYQQAGSADDADRHAAHE